jgi:hypothetical protein
VIKQYLCSILMTPSSGDVYHMQEEHIQGEEEASSATHPRSGVYAYYSCWMR